MICMESLRMKGVATSVGNRLSRGRFFYRQEGSALLRWGKLAGVLPLGLLFMG